MSLTKKLDKYEHVLQALCETDESIDHAVLVTAHKVYTHHVQFDTTVSVFHCGVKETREVLQAALKELDRMETETKSKMDLQ